MIDVDFEEPALESSIDSNVGDDNDVGDVNGDNSDDNGVGLIKNRTRARVEWSFEKVLVSLEEVETELENWSKLKEYKGDNKKWYKCSHDPKCPARMHLIFLSSDRTNMMVNGKDREHRVKEKGITLAIKAKIIEYYGCG